MKFPRDIEANVYFLTTNEGGRTTPAFDGYRPQFRYDERDWDASLSLHDSGTAEPGCTVRAFFAFASPAQHFGNVHVGTDFELREGARTIARGCVTRLVDLECSAKASK